MRRASFRSARTRRSTGGRSIAAPSRRSSAARSSCTKVGCAPHDMSRRFGNPRARYADRRDAGRKLAGVLAPTYAGRSDVLVLALPRGGVPVGYEIAAALQAPLDVFQVRKLGVPGHEELAMGALASG